MPSYRYRGRDKNGQLVEGLIEAASANNVAIKLSGIDIIPISIVITEDSQTVEDLLMNLFGMGLPSAEELIIFSQQMYALLKAGVSLIYGLKVVSETTKHTVFRNIITDVIISLESGYSFSKALSKHPMVFQPLMIAMVEVGENTGQLETSFLQIREYLETEQSTKQRIKTALRYPIIVIAAILTALIIINIMVIPAFRDFFSNFGAKLPLPTRILITTSDLFVLHGWLISGFCILMVIGALYYAHTIQGKWWISYFKLKIPFVGSIVRRSIYARFCRAFAMTISANVPLLQAFKVVANVTGNSYLSQKILNMRHHIELGESLYHAAKESNLFSPIALQMMAIGEETGEVDKILLDIAYYYEKDVDYDLKQLGDLIEPILIIIIALMVLLLALGVFLPMWDISTVALRKMDGV
ncbi:type II secretion system F family protein [Candidatus Berkiella aquae]|uniref:Type II secretion system F family protein n=1 Tax=Candidatus Berkiella aquae TaxID=295108 RepID=A0A0Q9YMW7_9GAMM|nr:type II secretion system F family protein [Candidatus Berkiella aquae]MCS5712670.1 type II secretion system F family protein [Candidatus Berkiella aquae]